MKDTNYKPQCQSDELEFKTILWCLGIMGLSAGLVLGGMVLVVKHFLR